MNLYSVGGGHSSLSQRAVKHKNELEFVSHGFDIDILNELDRVMKKINIYIWCSKMQISKLMTHYEEKGCCTDLLAWCKTNPPPLINNTYLSDMEYLVYAHEKGIGLGGTYETKHKYWVTPINKEDKDKWQHPTIKPLFIIKNLIINSSKEGDTILDCFMGSGTTGVACKRLKRNFIGIELDKKYFEIAQKRINELTLFDYL